MHSIHITERNTAHAIHLLKYEASVVSVSTSALCIKVNKAEA